MKSDIVSKVFEKEIVTPISEAFDDYQKAEINLGDCFNAFNVAESKYNNAKRELEIATSQQQKTQKFLRDCIVVQSNQPENRTR